MSGKLDQSLDDIMKTSRHQVRAGGRRRVGKPTKTGAPAGGVAKKAATKTGRAGKVAAVIVPAIPITGESKIVVSGLPADVSEQQIKEYFAKTVAPVKRVMLTYGPSGQSRGVATIIFNKPDSASKAAKDLNGVKVDNRTMKIEVVLGAAQAPVPVRAKALKDRIAQPKVAVKGSARSTAKTASKGPAKAQANGTTAKGRGRTAKGRSAGRGKPKSAEELDAEMTDYFVGGNGPAGETNGVANGAPTATNSGDVGMDDEIM